MAELEDLSARLSRLAAAVPVAPGRLDPVHRGAVEARQRVRMAWVTPLLVLAVGVTAFGLLGINPFDPGASPGPVASDPTAEASDVTAGPVVATDVDGPYSLELRAPRSVYLENEPIDLRGTFVYSGDYDVAVRYFWPHTFSIREQVHGLTLLAEHPILMNWVPCPPIVVLKPNERYEGTFAVSGFSPSPPTEEQAAFLADPQLRLPPGTWHLQVRAEVIGGGSCGANATTAPPAADVKLDAEIEIVVLPAAEPSVPAIAEPTSAPVATDPPIQPTAPPPPDGSPIAIDRDDAFELRMDPASRIFRTDEAIDLATAYTYIGPELDVLVGHFEPEISFGVEELDADGNVIGDMIRSKLYDSDCSGARLRADVPREVPITDHNLMSIRGSSLPGAFSIDLDEGVFRLAPGRWRITAHLSTYLGGCRDGQPDPERQHGLSVSTEIVVVPSGWTRVPLRSADRPASACAAAAGGGWLAADPTTGIGVDGGAGQTSGVQWPYGWTGWRNGAAVVLFDAAGREIARSGDRMQYGGAGFDGIFDACSDIEVVVSALSADAAQIPLLTDPEPNEGDGCRLALGSGSLVPDATSGIGIGAEGSESQPIRWPHGWTGWQDGQNTVLVDDRGYVVADSGDVVNFGGGLGVDGIFAACGGVWITG